MPDYSKYEPKACPRCNREHICTGSSNCACFDVEMDDHTLDHIAFHFDDCLCPDCLPAMKIQPITDEKRHFIDEKKLFVDFRLFLPVDK